MPSGLYWCRRIRVTIGSNENGQALEFGSTEFDENGNNSDYRIDFNVTRTRGKSANKGTISIYNLSAEERALIDSEYQRVQLVAGYQGDTPIEDASGFWGVILDGWIDKIRHRRSGGDIITQMTCVDGAVAQRRARVNLTYTEGESYERIARDIIARMPFITVGDISGIEGKRGVPAKGYVVSGAAMDELEKIAKLHDARATINNGVMEIISNGSGINNGYVVPLFDKDSGLISSSRTEKGVQFKAFLHPYVEPNKFVTIIDELLESGRDSRKTISQKERERVEEAKKNNERITKANDSSGIYRVNSVVFSGTNGVQGGDFSITVQGQKSDGRNVFRPALDQSPVNRESSGAKSVPS